VVLVLLIVLIVILLVQKVVSTYTAAETQAFSSNFAYMGQSGSDTINVINFYLASLSGQPLLPIVNGILTSAPSTVAQPLVPYTSETQLITMFGDASKNGESGLTFTDRYLLRYLTVLFIILLNSAQSKIGQVTWDAQGKPNFADEVLSKSQTVQENMKFIFELVKSSGGGDISQDVVTKINSILPSNVTPFASVEDYKTRQMSSTPDPSIIFITKYIMVGPAFLVWVAQNLYKLDPNFKCFNTVASPVQSNPIVPAPASPV